LRYYEAQGLLKADRGANGYREYDESAVLRVKQIRRTDAETLTAVVAGQLPVAAARASGKLTIAGSDSAIAHATALLTPPTRRPALQHRPGSS
jgi:hypothetical protein